MINYDLLLQEKIKENQSKNLIPKLLLHSCCGPCSTAVIERLKDYFEITILYYNPNIEPVEEYKKRKEEQLKVLKKFDNVTFMDCDYDNELFIEMSSIYSSIEEGGIRCHKCYRLRMEKCAILAKENNYDYFTTTLTVSPYKNSKIINEIGISLEKEYQIKYLCADFKKKNGYKRSIELSKEYDLYRQDYCGCRYSKK